MITKNDTWDIKAAHERLDACIKKQKARDERILRGWDYLYPTPSIKSDGTKTCPSFEDMNPELDKISSKNLSPRFEKLIDENFWELI